MANQQEVTSGPWTMDCHPYHRDYIDADILIQPTEVIKSKDDTIQVNKPVGDVFFIRDD